MEVYRQMSPFVIEIGFMVFLGILSLARPNAGRIFLGFFFLVMAFAVNGTVLATDPALFATLGRDSFIPLYRWLFDQVVGASPILWGVIAILYEVSTGLMLLHTGRWVKRGLICVIVFGVGTAPFMWLTVPNLVMAATAAYLLTREYDGSLFSRLRLRVLKQGGAR